MKKIILLLMVTLSAVTFAQQKKTVKKNKPVGYYIMENANCAGIKFNSEKSLTLISEFSCTPMELSLNWINEKTFYATELGKPTNCPPRVYFYTVVSNQGSVLKLKEHWVGWGVQPDEILTFNKFK